MAKEKVTFIRKREDIYVRKSVIPDISVKLVDICLNTSENGVLDELKEESVNQKVENIDLNNDNPNKNIFSSFSSIETVPIIYRKHLLATLKTA